MCVSTHEYHLMLGKNLISQLQITGKSCYYPPPTVNRVGSWRSRKNPATTPPTESRRLLEITEKTQEIKQPQLGSSAFAYGSYSSKDSKASWVEQWQTQFISGWRGVKINLKICFGGVSQVYVVGPISTQKKQITGRNNTCKMPLINWLGGLRNSRCYLMLGMFMPTQWTTYAQFTQRRHQVQKGRHCFPGETMNANMKLSEQCEQAPCQFHISWSLGGSTWCLILFPGSTCSCIQH